MDLLDIVLHSIIALAFASFLQWIIKEKFLLYIWLINFIVWLIREVYQHWPDVLEIVTPAQSFFGWVVFILVVGVCFVICKHGEKEKIDG